MFISLIEKRRSIRKFKDRPVESEKIDKLVEAALRSPSSRGSNPWEFVVVADKDLLEKLAKAKAHGSSFLAGAPLGIVICGDPEKSDVWVEDTAIVTTFIHLAATSLGLGSCWIHIRKRPHDDAVSAEEYVRSTLNIPDRLNILSMVAVGYPDEDKASHSKEALQFDKVHYNAYGTKKV
jgi:nitroreductase